MVDQDGSIASLWCSKPELDSMVDHDSSIASLLCSKPELHSMIWLKGRSLWTYFILFAFGSVCRMLAMVDCCFRWYLLPLMGYECLLSQGGVTFQLAEADCCRYIARISAAILVAVVAIEECACYWETFATFVTVIKLVWWDWFIHFIFILL